MKELNQMFIQRCANIICDTCEMGCCEIGKAQCTEKRDIFTCDIVTEKTAEIMQLFMDVTGRLFKNKLNGSDK